MFSVQALIQAAITVFVVMLAATIHEVAHGYTAYLCGDPTAKEAGRLSLNPLRHIDPFGSLILPFIMVLLGGPVFGYAKPVPYNPRRLRKIPRDEVLVALAGPGSNLVQAALGALIFHGLYNVAPGLLSQAPLVPELLLDYVWVNLILCFFNLIPLPPLDGSHVITAFLQGKARVAYDRIQPYTMGILLVVLYMLPEFFHISPLSSYFDVTAGPLFDLLIFGGLS